MAKKLIDEKLKIENRLRELSRIFRHIDLTLPKCTHGEQRKKEMRRFGKEHLILRSRLSGLKTAIRIVNNKIHTHH
jgi:hypothetical protein